MRIDSIFQRDVHRTIEDVIKVEVMDEEVVALEIDEYIATDHIQESFEDLLDAYAESVLKPTERTNVWISGFFGSGKSSFAKMFGYLLENPVVLGESAADRFCRNTDNAKIRALLNSAHEHAPTLTVFLDLSTGRNVASEGESLVLPLYRALLEKLDYSRNLLLAELEFALEGDDDLEQFEAAFEKATDGKSWRARRNIGLAKNEASHALHLLRPETYPQPDSWARADTRLEINHNWFAERAQTLLQRRGQGARRIAFVVDEVGQYVARSTERMLDLNGLAESVQRHRGPLWLVATSQERLSDVVDSLEGKQIELARVKDRFSLRADLLPTDIDEVTGRRVLSKTAAGTEAVIGALRPSKNMLATNLTLASPTREIVFDEAEFVRLYPLVPYQIQLLIDAVSARRAQGRGSPMLGGATRTIVKVAQQLIIRPEIGIGTADVGAMATMDRAYDLLREVVPGAWQSEVTQVAQKYGAGSLEARVMKVVALCLDVPALPLTPQNIAVLLHPTFDSESLRDDVAAALEGLVADDRLRRTEDGYRLQSPEQKGWDKDRRNLDPSPADVSRAVKATLKNVLVGLTASKGRAFKVELLVEGEKLADGDVTLAIEDRGEAEVDAVRTASREAAAASTVFWTYKESADTYEAATEAFRSATMVERRNTPQKTPAEVELLGDERARGEQWQRTLAERLQRDLGGGHVVFRGVVDEVSPGALKAMAQRLVVDRLGEIYDRLDSFSASLSSKDVLAVLRAEKLDGLPDALKDVGIGLIRLTPRGYEFATDQDPLAVIVAAVKERANYGNEATGSYLERTFGGSPYGAPVEVVEAVLAAALRSGLLEVVYQSNRIASADDKRLDKVFGPLPAFRSSVFRPPAAGPDLKMRTELAKKIGRLTGSNPPVAVEQLAQVVRDLALPRSEMCAQVLAGMSGAGLQVPTEVDRAASVMKRLREGDDAEVITTASQAWEEMLAGCEKAGKLHALLRDDIETLHRARALVQQGAISLPAACADELAQVKQVLSSDDVASQMDQVRKLTAAIESARQSAIDAAAAQLREEVGRVGAALRDSYVDVDAAAVDEALRALDDLMPPDDLSAASLPALLASRASISAQSAEIERVLDALAGGAEVARVIVGELVPEPIGMEEELAAALDRIRDAVESELADGRRVRLQ